MSKRARRRRRGRARAWTATATWAAVAAIFDGVARALDAHGQRVDEIIESMVAARAVREWRESR